MRNNIRNICLALSLASTPVMAKDILGSIPTDKRLHFLVSYGMTYTLSDILTRLDVKYPELWASLAVGTLGAYKEMYIDEAGDRNDMTANVIGIGLAAGIHYGVRW